MQMEPLTKKRRAQFEERTQGLEIVAMAALIVGGGLIFLLGPMTSRSLGIAAVVPCLAFAYIAMRTATAFHDVGVEHRSQRARLTAYGLVALSLVILLVQEAYLRTR
jgi:hypothetical protein